MAAPTITLLNHTLLDSADANTDWNDLTTADPDIKVEGSNSMSGIFRADGEQGYAQKTTAPATAVGKTFRGWIFTNNIAYMGTEASDPYKLLAWDGTTEELKTLFGSDTYPGGWFNIIWDMDDFTTLTLANVRRWGVEAGHASSAKNVVNTWMDAMRYLDGYSMTGGTSGDKVDLAAIALYDKGTTTLRGYGVVTEVNGVYFCTGDVQFGTGATTHYFEMDGEVLVFTEQMVAAGLYKLSGVGTGTDIVIKNSVIRSTGASDNTRFILDFDDVDLAALSFLDNLVVRAGLIHFKTGQTCTGNTFDDCGQIDPDGADLTGSTVKNYQGTPIGALLYNNSADPDGELDDMVFVKGTATKHAIQFGTTAPTTLTLRGIDFQGYNASDQQNDSALYFPDKGTDTTWTVNLVGCSGNLKYFKARTGDTVNLVIDPVTLTFAPLVANTEVRIYQAGTTTEVAGVENSGTSFDYIYTYPTGYDVDIVIHHVGYEHIRVNGFELPTGDASFPVSQRVDPNYSNPT